MRWESSGKFIALISLPSTSRCMMRVRQYFPTSKQQKLDYYNWSKERYMMVRRKKIHMQ